MVDPERVLNTTKGVLAGDAFCFGSEFCDRNWLTDNLSFSGFSNNRNEGFRTGFEPGDYSDDGEHTIAVIRALISGQELTTSLLINLFKDEHDQDKERKGYARQGYASSSCSYRSQYYCG